MNDITVLIPTINNKPLNKTINSVINQEYHRLEIIVLRNGFYKRKVIIHKKHFNKPVIFKRSLYC